MTGKMRLYITPTSPYARLVRIVVREKGMEDRVEDEPVVTRSTDSPYYVVNPSGRVPCLELPDGRLMEDSPLICDYLDELDGAPAFSRPTGADRWEFAMAEARAHGLLDGLAVLIRERHRAAGEQSPTVIAHELARARRLLATWEEQADAPVLTGPLNYVQIVLAIAGEVAGRAPELRLAGQWPRMAARLAAIGDRPSFAATAPPA